MKNTVCEQFRMPRWVAQREEAVLRRNEKHRFAG